MTLGVHTHTSRIATWGDDLSANIGLTIDEAYNPYTPYRCTCSSCDVCHPADGLCACERPVAYTCRACRPRGVRNPVRRNMPKSARIKRMEALLATTKCAVCGGPIAREELNAGRVSAMTKNLRVSCSATCREALRVICSRESLARAHREQRQQRTNQAGGRRAEFLAQHGEAVPCAACQSPVSTENMTASQRTVYSHYAVAYCNDTCQADYKRRYKREQNAQFRLDEEADKYAAFIAAFGTVLPCSVCATPIEVSRMTAMHRSVYAKFEHAFCSTPCRQAHRAERNRQYVRATRAHQAKEPHAADDPAAAD